MHDESMEQEGHSTTPSIYPRNIHIRSKSTKAKADSQCATCTPAVIVYPRRPLAITDRTITMCGVCVTRLFWSLGYVRSILWKESDTKA